MNLPSIEVSHLVPANINNTFEVFTDIDNCAERIEAIVSTEPLQDGPPGEGWRWKETRKMGKREHTGEFWIENWNPPHSYQVITENAGVQWISQFTFSEQGDSTNVVMTCEWKNKGIMLRLMGWMIKRMMKSEMKKDLEQLSAFVQY